ncbi:hypothetical protein EON81_09935, partial [bacterium]
MSRILGVFAALLLLVLLGCGGGGGGGSSTDGTTGVTQTVFSGQVIDVATGIAVTPAATVTIGGSSTQTEDGLFSVTAPRTSSQVNLTNTPYGNWNFPFTTTTAADLDLGLLYIGPTRVTVTGTATDATTNEPIAGARVEFAGRSAISNARGVFSISGVAYSATNQSGFFGIVGQATATGYVSASFDANGVTATGGVVEVGEVRLFSSGDTTPPDGPYNLTGRVSGKPTGATLEIVL